MYIPEAFRETRLDLLQAFMQQHSFGLLVSHQAGCLEASHLPLLLDADRGPSGTLIGHMARANPQWRGFRAADELLVIFSGPHAYISPSWYETRLSVPTWNYAAVHAYGVPHLVEEPAAVRSILEAMVQTYEAPFDAPWPMDLPDDFVERMMKAIVGFEITITRLDGKLKLGQNRSQADQLGAIAGLTRQGDPSSLAVATLMQEALGAESLVPEQTTLLSDHSPLTTG
jgi:transcriptional regulator